MDLDKNGSFDLESQKGVENRQVFGQTIDVDLERVDDGAGSGRQDEIGNTKCDGRIYR